MKSLEEIGIWNLARKICKLIFELTRQEPLCKDFELVNQIRRSSRSVMDNIAEGYGRGGNKEFLQFLAIAKGSCCEAQSQIYQLADCDYISTQKFEELIAEIRSVYAGIVNLMEYLRNSEYKGSKYR